MAHTNNKTMKEAVSHLREDATEALVELFELHVAVGQLALTAPVLSAAGQELATESARLADAPELASSERLRALAKAAARTSEVIDGQAKVVTEIQSTLDAWGLTRPGLRVV